MTYQEKPITENLFKENDKSLGENISTTSQIGSEHSSLDTNKKSNFKENRELGPENQDYWYYCSHSFTSGLCSDFDKESKHRFDKEKSHGKKMESLICNSYETLHEYFDLKYQLPFNLFQSCKGIMFLRLWKGGLFLGGIGGTGIVLAHLDNTWSAPCAVSVGGLQIGFQVGIERVDDILLLHDDSALKLFIEQGHFRLGIDASIAVGSFGRDSNTAVVMGQGGESKSIYSYSFAKGAFIGLSLDGGTLSVDDKVNEEYYGYKMGVKDILYGNIQIPQHQNELIKMKEFLNSYCGNEKFYNESASIQNIPTSNTQNF